MRCTGPHMAGTVIPEATGRVRHIDPNGSEVVSNPFCDTCQVAQCIALRPAESAGKIREVGAVPLDYRERLAEATREGIKRRIRQEIERHPGSPAEIADDLLAVILDVGKDYTVPALVDLLGARIAQWQAERDEASATMAAEIDPEEVF